MGSQADGKFRPALLVVDLQEDFCPPNGTLAVTGGRDIAPTINELMKLPFTLKVATQDWHPADHVSFASNHPAPNNKPFESMMEVKNPLNEAEVETIRLWPVHCVQDSPGAEFIPEFDVLKLDRIVKKGLDKRVEMYSAFKDTYTNPCVGQSDLSQILKDADITHVYVVGLAEDFCVRHTASHAAGEGYQTYILVEGTRAVDQQEESLQKLRKDLAAENVQFKSVNSAEVKKVAALA